MVKNVKMEIIVKNYIYLFTFVRLVLQVLGLQACTAIPGVCGGGGGGGVSKAGLPAGQRNTPSADLHPRLEITLKAPSAPRNCGGWNPYGDQDPWVG